MFPRSQGYFAKQNWNVVRIKINVFSRRWRKTRTLIYLNSVICRSYHLLYIHTIYNVWSFLLWLNYTFQKWLKIHCTSQTRNDIFCVCAGFKFYNFNASICLTARCNFSSTSHSSLFRLTRWSSSVVRCGTSANIFCVL